MRHNLHRRTFRSQKAQRQNGGMDHAEIRRKEERGIPFTLFYSSVSSRPVLYVLLQTRRISSRYIWPWWLTAAHILLAASYKCNRILSRMPCYCSFLCTFLHYARYFIGKSEHFVIICCWDRDICSTIPELGNVHVKYTAQCRVVIKKYLAARHDQCYLILTHCSYWIQSLCFITLTDME